MAFLECVRKLEDNKVCNKDKEGSPSLDVTVAKMKSQPHLLLEIEKSTNVDFKPFARTTSENTRKPQTTSQQNSKLMIKDQESNNKEEVARNTSNALLLSMQDKRKKRCWNCLEEQTILHRCSGCGKARWAGGGGGRGRGA